MNTWKNWKIGDKVYTYVGEKYIVEFLPFNFGENCKIIVADKNGKNQMTIHDNHLN